MKIILLRHGDNVDDNLTPLGKKQSQEAVCQLDYENITKIYSSPLKRTRDTAKIVAKSLGIDKITTDERIIEREKPTENMSEKEIEEFNNNYLNASFERKNPEGCKNYIDRVFAFLNDVINSSEKDDNILIVCHSSMSYVVGSFFFGIPKDNKLVWTRIGNCSKVCYEYIK